MLKAVAASGLAAKPYYRGVWGHAPQENSSKTLHAFYFGAI